MLQCEKNFGQSFERKQGREGNKPWLGPLLHDRIHLDEAEPMLIGFMDNAF